VASGEGKPVVSPHPSRLVDPNSWSWSARGHIQNVRVGPKDKNGDVTLIGDLHIHDAGLIDKIANGLRDLSCGYSYEMDRLRDGTYVMRNIRLNHVAVVESGRAGTTQIMDSRSIAMNINERMDRVCDLLERYLASGFEAEESDPDLVSEAITGADSGAQRRDIGPDFFEQARHFHRRNPREVSMNEARHDHTAHDSAIVVVDFFEAARRCHRRDLREIQAELARG